MKNFILILLLLFSMTTFSQEVRKKCITIKKKNYLTIK